MAKCDEGYICAVCGKPVKGILQSDLYLRFVIGWIDPEVLHLEPETHIRCNPSLAQFIDDPDFSDVQTSEGFESHGLDPAFAESRREMLTRGYRRLKELNKSDLPIEEYPLPEAREKYGR